MDKRTVEKKRLMVIDGNSLMHRAFYAIPVLSNKKGVYTNAVYGFTNMLLKLVEDYQPDYIGVAFDRKAPTFRHEEFADYKAKRQKAPEELLPQMELVRKLLKEMNIAIFEKDGFEADDILGTFANLAQKKGIEALLVTGDRDALQLVSTGVTVLLTRKGISDIHRYDVEEIKKEYGLTPEKIIDLKALMGDSSDNIPGVPGIGEKTALKLLHQFSSLEDVLDNVDKVPGRKLRENIFKYTEQALLSKKLATIVKDVPLDIDLEKCKCDIPASEGLKKLLEELEFKSILARLHFDDGDSKPVKVIERENRSEVVIKSARELAGVLEALEGEGQIAILYGENISLACGDGKLWNVHLQKDLAGDGILWDEALGIMKSLLENEKVAKVIHDGKRLILDTRRLGVELKGFVFDTFIAAYLLESTRNRYDFEQLLYDYLGIDVKQGNAADLLALAREMKKRLEDTGMLGLYENIEHPLIEVLADMEVTGFRVDRELLEEIGRRLSEDIAGLTEKIYELARERFNINSTKQLGAVLFEKLKLPVVKKTKTGYSTDIEVLEKLRGQHEIVDRIIEYRQLVKLKTTYIDGLLAVIDPDDGRIHSSFNQTVTATGRISSTEPNLQNIPVKLEKGRQIRKVFVASDEEHVLVDADYSQIELRVLAHMSQDPAFIEAFRRNEDIHTRTAAEIFGVPPEEVTPEQRSRAKAVNFGIVYGISDYGLARNLGISRKEAKSYIDRYFERYPGIKRYMEEVVRKAREQGYVTTLMNRRRNLPELKSRNRNVRAFGERVAMNTPIQGTAADIIKKAMNDVYSELKRRGLKSRLVLQVHDELIIDTYRPELEEVKKLLRDCMENAVKLSVPLVVDIGVGYSWYDAK